MTIQIAKNESLASLRVVPIWLVQSNGTSAATNESGATFNFSIGGAYYGSGGSLSAVSANMGHYVCAFAASKLSIVGPATVMYSSGTAIQASTDFQIIDAQYVSFKTILNGTSVSDFTLSSTETSNATALRGAFMVLEFKDGTKVGRFLSQVTCSGGTVVATADYPFPAIPESGASYTLFPQTANIWSQLTGTSNATILGVTNLDSAVTLKAVTHSGATIQGVTRLNSSVTLNADTHSGATIQGVTRVNSSVTPADATYSGVTVRIDPQNYSGLTIQGVTRVNSSVTPANALYSGVTVRVDPVSYSGLTISGLLGAVTVDYPSVATAVWSFSSGRTAQIANGTYSGVTISGILGTVTATVDYPSVATAVWSFSSGRTSQIAAGSYSGVTIDGVNRLNSNVTLNAATHSGATIQGLSNYANISNVTLAAGTHSGVTIQGVTRVNSSVTPADATYSAVTVRIDPVSYSGLTIQGLSNYANISSVTLNAGVHSGATIDGAKFLSTAGERSIASSYLSSDLGNSRLVQEALFMNRNRVEGVIPGSSILTVYKTDDTTSSWTATPSFNTFGGLSGFNPA